MANHQAGTSGGPQEEFTVRIPRDNRKKFTMMKFRSGANVDFTKLGEQAVKLERENNLKEYKTANDLDMMPKFGAGSEYGRDQKEESRRKKYGIMLKKYNPEDQPWLMKIGNGKQAKKFKGVREGTITENTSYFIFTKAADGAFEAYPVEKWYNFSPMIRYKYLNSEEAEAEYNKRHKNYFSIMQKYKVKTKDEDNADDEVEKGSSKGKKKKRSDLILTDMEDWDAMQISDDDDSDGDEDKDGDEDGKPKKKKKGKTMGKKKKKNAKQNSDDEAVEESDEGDYDDREVDYMSDSGSESSLSGPEEDNKDKKYDQKGVDQEDGLRNILDSGDEDEDEENQTKDELEEEVNDKDNAKEEKKKGDDDSSSSSSEDDSDFEKEGKLASLFLQDQKPEKKDKIKSEPSTADSGVKLESSSPAVADKQKALKRKAEKTPDGKSPLVKRQRPEDSEGISEDSIRRYLMRKPMTTKDLFLKFKSKKLNISNEKITHVIAQLLKKINPDKNVINKKLYLSLKKPE